MAENRDILILNEEMKKNGTNGLRDYSNLWGTTAI